MARIATLATIRANQLAVGGLYTMSAWKKSETNPVVTFQGFFDGEGNLQPNPKVLKGMPQDWTMKVVDVMTGEETVITKDPEGYGAMFVGKVRVTFFEDPAQADARKAAKTASDEAAKAERAAKREEAKAAKAAEKAAKEKTEADKKAEAEAVVETTEEVTAEG